MNCGSAAIAAEIAAEERERLILQYLPQVHLIARRIQERLPDNISLDDLISSGVIGLISAIDNFDAKYNVKLKTYAEYRIRGAILDSLRDLDWAPRLKRKKAKQIEAALAAAEQRLQRAPLEEEIAAELHLTLEEYREWLVEIRGLNFGNVEYASGGDGRDLLQHVADLDERLPSNLFERAELQALVTGLISRMPAIERTVLGLYYDEERTLREIAEILDLHESRISQLKLRAILRIRSEMTKHWPTTAGRDDAKANRRTARRSG